jgi:hypothetical protein
MRKSVWFLALIAALAVLSPALAQQNGRAGDDQNGLPPEQALQDAPLIQGVAEAPASVGEDITYYPYNSSLGYKGVVMGNFNNSDANDELYADFGTTGLWYYNNNTWTQVSGLNPDAMISATMVNTTDDELIVDFGATGLWLHDGGTSWIQLSGVNAEGMFAVDDDNDGADEIQVDFGSLGVWRNDAGGPSSWIQVSGLNPYNGLQMDVGGYLYEEACWSFPSVGVWNIYMSGTSAIYHQLSGTVNSNDDHATGHFTNAAGAEDLIMDFGSTLGLWLYGEAWGPWYQISTMWADRVKAVKFVGGPDDELLAQNLDTGYLQWGNWNGTTFTWTNITNAAIGPGWVETFDKDGADSGDEEVVIPNNAGGAYWFDYSAGSVLSQFISLGTNWHIRLMVKGDYYNRGYDSTLAVVFDSTSDSPGLWLWDQATSWVKISSYVPDGIY